MLRMWKEDKSWTFQFNLNFRFEITSSLPTGRLYIVRIAVSYVKHLKLET